MIDLSAAGLSETEAKCYKALLSRQSWQPSALAKNVNESRTNMYKILDKLVDMKLAKKFDKDKKIHYQATHPSRLVELAHTQREAREAAEKRLELEAQNLMQDYLHTHEQAGVRYFQGQEEIRRIFQEIADSKEEVVFVHTTHSVDFYGFKSMHNLRMLAPNAGVKRRALTVDTQKSPKNYQEVDPLVLLKRTWLKQHDYTSPVEWGAFDDKLYIISYGEEAMGLVLQSKQIADGFKQLFSLLERGQRLLPNYSKLPINAQSKGKTAERL